MRSEFGPSGEGDVKLPDVNVWLAAVRARHVHHSAVKEWFDREDEPIAFCRITEMAVLRLLTNRTVMGDDVLTRRAAWGVVEALLADPRVGLEREPEGLDRLWMTFSKHDDTSHLLWTDDYLAAFAGAADAELVTLEHAWRERYPSVRVRCLL